MINRLFKKIFMILPMLLLPGFAFAGPIMQTASGKDWTIQAFGNGHVLYSILDGAKGMLQPGNTYSHFIIFIALIGIIVVSVAAAHRADSAKKMLGSFLALFVFTSIGLNITGNVTIEDPINNTVDAITDVPVILFLPVAVVSTTGHYVTKSIEQYYSLPNDLTMTGGGSFNIGNSLIQASTQIRITDPLLHQTLEQYAENCIIPALASGRLNSYQLVTSTDLWGGNGKTTGILSSVNQSALTTVYSDQSPSGVIVSCGPKGAISGGATVSNTDPSIGGANNAFDYLRQYFNQLGGSFNTGTSSGYTNTAMYSFMSAASLGNAQTQLMNGAMSTTGSGSIEQAAAINALRPAMNAASIASGNSDQVTAMAISEGEQTQKSNWGTAAIMFQDLSGYLFSVLQAFLLAITPLILAALFIPGSGKKIVVSYFQVVIWLALWEPMLSVINYIVDLFSQGPLGGSMGGYAGYTMLNLPAVSSETANLTAAAGFLAAMTPMITWGLVKGGIAFTEFLSQGMGGYMARSAAGAAATGNITLDNQSFHNRTQDQWMLRSSVTAGIGAAMVSSTSAGATSVSNEATHEANVGSSALSNMVQATRQQVVAEMKSKATSAGTTAQQSAEKAETFAQSGSESVGKDLSGTSSGSTTLNAGTGNASSQDARKGFEHRLAEDLGEKFNQTEVSDMARTAGIKTDGMSKGNMLESLVGKVGVNGLAHLAGGLSAGVQGTARDVYDHSKSGSKTDASGETSGASSSMNYGSSAAYQQGMSDVYSSAEKASKGYNETAATNFKKAATLTHTAATQYNDANTYTENASEAASVGGNLGFKNEAEAQAAIARLRAIQAGTDSPLSSKVEDKSKVVKTEVSNNTGDATLAAGKKADADATTNIKNNESLKTPMYGGYAKEAKNLKDNVDSTRGAADQAYTQTTADHVNGTNEQQGEVKDEYKANRNKIADVVSANAEGLKNYQDITTAGQVGVLAVKATELATEAVLLKKGMDVVKGAQGAAEAGAAAGGAAEAGAGEALLSESLATTLAADAEVVGVSLGATVAAPVVAAVSLVYPKGTGDGTMPSAIPASVLDGANLKDSGMSRADLQSLIDHKLATGDVDGRVIANSRESFEAIDGQYHLNKDITQSNERMFDLKEQEEGQQRVISNPGYSPAAFRGM